MKKSIFEHKSIKSNYIFLDPPELTTMKSWIHTAPGFRTQLDCRVTSDPTSEIIWYKGDNPVTYDNRVLFLGDDEKYSLIIKNVQPSDFGFYTCRAVNDIGEETLEFQLSGINIIRPLEIKLNKISCVGVPNPAEFKPTDDKNTNAQDSYTLIWEVDSFTPVIEYRLWFRPYKSYPGFRKPEWRKLTIPTEYKSNTGYTYSKMYTIEGLKEGSTYEALILSRNRYGWSKANPIIKFTTQGIRKFLLVLFYFNILMFNYLHLYLAETTEDITTPVETETENILENIIPSKMESRSSSISNVSPCKVIIIMLLFILR